VNRAGQLFHRQLDLLFQLLIRTFKVHCDKGTEYTCKN
jgi:hypothetical protein